MAPVGKILLEDGGYLLLEDGGEFLLEGVLSVFPVSGLFAQGVVGTVSLGGWTSVNDTQVPNWVNLNDAQSPLWGDIDKTT